MNLKTPIKCHCSTCDQDFLRLRNRGNMDICTPCQRKERLAKWLLSHPNKKIEYNRKWSALNKETERLMKKEWSLKNKGAENAKAAKYRATKQKACPSWADRGQMKAIYANCPSGFHVDHIVPLQGKRVSGLHVEFNLQYLPALENIKKSNQFEGNP